jgi:hypothetical protein
LFHVQGDDVRPSPANGNAVRIGCRHGRTFLYSKGQKRAKPLTCFASPDLTGPVKYRAETPRPRSTPPYFRRGHVPCPDLFRIGELTGPGVPGRNITTGAGFPAVCFSGMRPFVQSTPENCRTSRL